VDGDRWPVTLTCPDDKMAKGAFSRWATLVCTMSTHALVYTMSTHALHLSLPSSCLVLTTLCLCVCLAAFGAGLHS